jgi:predicted O-methyltransferase YrrM
VAPAVGVDVVVALLIASAMIGTALALWLHRLVRRGQRAALEATATAATQTEALFSIFATLEVTAPLPTLGGWAASPDLLRLLLDVLLRERPSLVLEASSGASTVVLAYGLRRIGAGGRVISLEHDPSHAARTREALASAGLSEVATVLDAPLVDHTVEGASWRWYDLASLPRLPLAGLLVVDGPPGGVQPLARYPALPRLEDRLTETAVVVMDDARRSDERVIAERWSARPGGWQVEFRGTEKGTAILRRNAPVG